VVNRVPQILGCDVTYDLHRKVAILQALGVTSIARWLTKNPQVVLMDVEAEMRPAVEFYRRIDGLDMGKVLSALPCQVAFAPPERTKGKLQYFQKTLGIANMGLMLTREPRLLTYSVEGNIEPKMELLGSFGITDVSTFVARNPNVFTFSTEVLASKLNYILTDMERPIDEVVAFPKALNYSVSWLRRRHRYLKMFDLDKKPSLSRLVLSSDYQFSTKLAKRNLLEFQQFTVASTGGADEDAADELPSVDTSLRTRSRVDEFLYNRTNRLRSDQERLDAVEQFRTKLHAFLAANPPTDPADQWPPYAGETPTEYPDLGDYNDRPPHEVRGYGGQRGRGFAHPRYSSA